MRHSLAFFAAAWAALNYVVETAVARLDPERNHTYICLRFTDEKLDAIFKIAEPLFGEALHQRLDALLEEHQDHTLYPEVWVVVYDEQGRLHEEEIRLGVV